jgi:hypothetical protein
MNRAIGCVQPALRCRSRNCDRRGSYLSPSGRHAASGQSALAPPDQRPERLRSESVRSLLRYPERRRHLGRASTRPPLSEQSRVQRMSGLHTRVRPSRALRRWMHVYHAGLRVFPRRCLTAPSTPRHSCSAPRLSSLPDNPSTLVPNLRQTPTLLAATLLALSACAEPTLPRTDAAAPVDLAEALAPRSNIDPTKRPASSGPGPTLYDVLTEASDSVPSLAGLTTTTTIS